MATTKKALAMAEELVSELKQRQGALAVSLSFDTDKNPLVKIGSGVAGAKGALVKIMPIAWPLAKDILGLDQTMYTPHKTLVSFEAPTVGAGADTDPNTWAEKLLVLAAVINKGTRVEVYQAVAGAAPAVADFAGTCLASFEPSAQYGMLAGQ